MGSEHQIELRDILDRSWPNRLFGRKPTRDLIAHLTIAPFLPHDKQKLQKNLGISTTSLYRAINDLKDFDLVELTPKTVEWKKTKLGKMILNVGVLATVEMVGDEVGQ